MKEQRMRALAERCAKAARAGAEAARKEFERKAERHAPQDTRKRVIQ